MNCHQAQLNLALWVGQDLDDAQEVAAVREHLRGCAGCRVHYQRLKHTQAALEQFEPPATFDEDESLWPRVAERLGKKRTDASSDRGGWRGWIPPVASLGLAACLLILCWPGGPQQTQQPTDSVPHINRGVSMSPLGIDPYVNRPAARKTKDKHPNRL